MVSSRLYCAWTGQHPERPGEDFEWLASSQWASKVMFYIIVCRRFSPHSAGSKWLARRGLPTAWQAAVSEQQEQQQEQQRQLFSLTPFTSTTLEASWVAPPTPLVGSTVCPLIPVSHPQTIFTCLSPATRKAPTFDRMRLWGVQVQAITHTVKCVLCCIVAWLLKNAYSLIYCESVFPLKFSSVDPLLSIPSILQVLVTTYLFPSQSFVFVWMS